jgi:hypothetical protein
VQTVPDEEVALGASSLAEGTRRGPGGGQEGTRKGPGGGQEGARRGPGGDQEGTHLYKARLSLFGSFAT